jgi:hypothetical protein
LGIEGKGIQSDLGLPLNGTEADSASASFSDSDSSPLEVDSSPLEVDSASAVDAFPLEVEVAAVKLCLAAGRWFVNCTYWLHFYYWFLRRTCRLHKQHLGVYYYPRVYKYHLRFKPDSLDVFCDSKGWDVSLGVILAVPVAKRREEIIT